MTTAVTTHKIELAELANKLFMYCDARQWGKMLDEVFVENVWFDMSSAGGGQPAEVKAVDICRQWEQGLRELDAVHHQAGQYLITVRADKAEIFAYAIASHYRKAAKNGQVRSFTGSYDLKAQLGSNGWRLTEFVYHLKFIDGNSMLE